MSTIRVAAAAAVTALAATAGAVLAATPASADVSGVRNCNDICTRDLGNIGSIMIDDSRCFQVAFRDHISWEQVRSGSTDLKVYVKGKSAAYDCQEGGSEKVTLRDTIKLNGLTLGLSYLGFSGNARTVDDGVVFTTTGNDLAEANYVGEMRAPLATGYTHHVAGSLQLSGKSYNTFTSETASLIFF